MQMLKIVIKISLKYVPKEWKQLTMSMSQHGNGFKTNRQQAIIWTNVNRDMTSY